MPFRLLGLVHLSFAVGRGMYLSGNIIYFTTVSGLSATDVGFGISGAALSGFIASLTFGSLSDRVGAKRVLALLITLQSGGYALYPAVPEIIPFYALIVVMGFIEFGVGPALGALVGSMTPPEERVRIRAVLHAVFNIGFSVGSGFSAMVLLGGDGLLRVFPWICSALLLLAVVLTLRLPGGKGRIETSGARVFGALRDLRFVTVTALSTPLALHSSIIFVALPLWAINHTKMPAALVPLLLVANAIFTVLFQVAASRRAATVYGAARLAGRSAMWLAAACAVAASAVYGDALVATVVISIAMLLFTVAELQQAASGWGLAHGLAPERAQGEYLGTFNLHMVTQGVLGPGLVSALIMSYKGWGWAAIAALVFCAGLAIVPAADTAARKRFADAGDTLIRRTEHTS
nr:MFS transporter [Sphaerisporangium album]